MPIWSYTYVTYVVVGWDTFFEFFSAAKHIKNNFQSPEGQKYAQKRALVLKSRDSDLKVPKSRLDRNYATCQRGNREEHNSYFTLM